MSGLFITVDGLDGIGKSTLVRDLAAALCADADATPGLSFCELRRPVLDALGADEAARAVFYSSTVISRGHAAQRAASEGCRVVMDRYWLSTVGYAYARGVPKHLSQLEGLVPKPDVSVVLVLDEGVRRSRLLGRDLITEADRETLKPAFRQAVLEHFTSDAARSFAPLCIVDVSGADRAEAVRRVMEAVTITLRKDPPHLPEIRMGERAG